MKLTNEHVLAIDQAAGELLARSDLGTKARYALVVNGQRSQLVRAAFQAATPNSPEIDAYAAALATAPTEDAIAALNEQYKEALDARHATVQEALAIEVEFPVHPIRLEWLPDTGVTTMQIVALMPLIEAE